VTGSQLQELRKAKRIVVVDSPESKYLLCYDLADAELRNIWSPTIIARTKRLWRISLIAAILIHTREPPHPYISSFLTLKPYTARGLTFAHSWGKLRQIAMHRTWHRKGQH
jgi:hypothetical protein